MPCKRKTKWQRNHGDLGDRKHGAAALARAGTTKWLRAKKRQRALIKKLITKRQNLFGARIESRNKNHKPDTKSENRILCPLVEETKISHRRKQQRQQDTGSYGVNSV
jgi:hypothetical protein